jgi:heme-degrading monooxygenase HmoA
MFSVIFEVHPKKEQFDLYLALAKDLKPILQGIDGFVDNERFESARRPGWILSHSTWRDEKSVVRWRTVAKHHEIQQRGRDDVFQDYHLRVGEVVSDTAPPDGATLVEQRLDETEVGAGKFATLTEVLPASAGAGSLAPSELNAPTNTQQTRSDGFSPDGSFIGEIMLAHLKGYRTSISSTCWCQGAPEVNAPLLVADVRSLS